jgi:NADH:ubiquinone reductase (H+-translocating)
MDPRPHVVIVGGGFAGLAAAKALPEAYVRVTVVDRRNHHLFQPLLYQVATAALNPSDIAAPIRAVLSKYPHVSVLLGEVARVDPAAHKLTFADGAELGYDYLVLATGATHSYFGHDDWAQNAPGLKTIEDALEIRRQVLYAYEAAEREPDPVRRMNWLTFVVVGAGPTGVELAGALAEIARHALKDDFRTIDPGEARVLLLEGQDRVLPAMDPELGDYARRSLTDLGVDVRTKVRVTRIADEEVECLGEHGEKILIPAHTSLWAAGVSASPIGASLGVARDRAGRVQVEPDLTIPGHPEIYVVGDLAAAVSEGKPVPGLAPAAMQAGRHAAENILNTIRGEQRTPFVYWDKGNLATIGRASAVGGVGKLHLYGYLAWLAWLFVHLMYLVGFRNRVLVLMQWAWAYVTYQRGARLITGAVDRKPPPAVP